MNDAPKNLCSVQTYILFQYYNPYWYIYCLCQHLCLSASVAVLCLCEMERGRTGGLGRVGADVSTSAKSEVEKESTA